MLLAIAPVGKRDAGRMIRALPILSPGAAVVSYYGSSS